MNSNYIFHKHYRGKVFYTGNKMKYAKNISKCTRYKLNTHGEYRAKNKDNYIGEKTLEGYKMNNNIYPS